MTWQQEQERFWRWINQPQDLPSQAGDIAALLAPHSHLSQAEALSIYNNAYHQRLVEISSTLFPVLFNSLGRDVYTRLWIGYMGKYPPRNGPIHHVGEHLREYVSTHEQFRSLPAVADIVHLESLLISLFDVTDEAPCTLAQLQALPPEDWPSMRWQGKQDWALLQSRFDLEKYWRQMQEFIANGGEPGTAEFGVELWERLGPARREDLPAIGSADRGQGPLPQGGAIPYLVYRKQHRMHFQAISPELDLLLQSVRHGETFAQICERLATMFPAQDIPQLSLTLLLKTIDLELLCAPKLPTNAG
ncbi:MAG: putative DNA-binding domain-containing protein [Pseudohongiellaceae bacterium]